MTTPGDPATENLTTSLRRVERQKRSLEEWTSTLERTVTAHERLARERQVERETEREAHSVELRVRAQELAAVEKRLTRTLESQSFRLGHLLVRMAVTPVKALSWMGRAPRRKLVVVYRLAQRTLPGRVVDPLQRAATRGQVTTARRTEVLALQSGTAGACRVVPVMRRGPERRPPISRPAPWC